MNKLTSKQVDIYCDGACSGNPGPGGWGAVLLMEGGWRKKISGFEAHTTNNRMELLASINALAAIKYLIASGDLHEDASLNITIYTDSVYVRSGITEWIKKWKMNNWKSGTIKNQDLWMNLDSLCQDASVEWVWVKGHSGNHYNEMADALARNAIKKGREG